tara:strand:+ start:89 stop:595 length:507 start_codon:yes stop_codon:yes gene_type:complete
MKISEGNIVKFTHKVINKQNIEIVSYQRELLFIPGCVNEKLYNAMLGQCIGKKLHISFTKEEIGPHDPSKIIKIPRDKINYPDKLTKGMLFKTVYKESQILGHVAKLNQNYVYIDINPHLNILSEDIMFEVDILDIKVSHGSTAKTFSQTLNLALNKEDSVLLIDSKI